MRSLQSKLIFDVEELQVTSTNEILCSDTSDESHGATFNSFCDDDAWVVMWMLVECVVDLVVFTTLPNNRAKRGMSLRQMKFRKKLSKLIGH